MTVVDFHVHLPEYEVFCDSAYDWFSQKFPSRADYQAFCRRYSDPDNFIGLMEHNGVDYSVVLAEVAPLTTGIATNEIVRNYCSGNPQLIPFCTFNPYMHSNMASRLEQSYADLSSRHRTEKRKLHSFLCFLI